jgi:hypothetical protein
VAEAQQGAEVLTDVDEMLWRNVHPTWIDNGAMTSQAFRPTGKDAGRLSTARSGVVTAQEHFTEHTESRGLESAGVWAISVGEASELELPCMYDEHSPSLPQPAPKGHTSIDFSGLSGGETRKKAGALRDRAESRGRRHP